MVRAQVGHVRQSVLGWMRIHIREHAVRVEVLRARWQARHQCASNWDQATEDRSIELCPFQFRAGEIPITANVLPLSDRLSLNTTA